MAVCDSCGTQVVVEARYCSGCGTILAPQPVEEHFEQVEALAQVTPGIDNADYTCFLGKNAFDYMHVFRKFSASGRDRFVPTWNWPAFLFGFLWFLYRKQYFWAFIGFFVLLAHTATPLLQSNLIHWTWPITSTIFGFTANYIYYVDSRDRIKKIRSVIPPNPWAQLTEAGGINNWVVPFGFAVAALLVAIFFPDSLLKVIGDNLQFLKV